MGRKRTISANAQRTAAGRLIDPALLESLAKRYHRLFRLPMVVTDANGKIVQKPKTVLRTDSSPAACQQRAFAVSETLRWGEPTPQWTEGRPLVWAMPIMHNNQVLGGLVVTAPEDQLFDRKGDRMDPQTAVRELQRMVEEANLTNAAMLETRRTEYHHERQRAEGIHSYKQQAQTDIRRMFMLDEPALIAAIRRNDRFQARAILNRILAAIIHQAGNRLEVVKSFFMELIVSMTRMAVQIGGSPQELLGANYRSITELARIESDETLAPWLHQMLESIMDAIQRRSEPTGTLAIAQAMEYLQEHFAQDVSRDDLARQVHLSPAHFSRLFRKQTGRNFTETLNRLRVEKAQELLIRTDRPLADVAQDAGFPDQSYFTKVFRRSTGQTPKKYRMSHRAGAPDSPTANGAEEDDAGKSREHETTKK